MSATADLLRSLPNRDLMAELIRRWPGRRIRVPVSQNPQKTSLLTDLIRDLGS